MISVGMTTYNTARYLGEAIESILNQTYTDFELIVVNNGSTDNTAEILQRFVDRDARVKVITIPHNTISFGASQYAQAATREWIAVMDSDDISLPQRLEKELAFVQANPKVVMTGSHVYLVNSNDEIMGVNQWGPKTEAEFYEWRKRGQIPQILGMTALLKRETLLKIGGYDPQFIAASDLDLCERFCDHGLVLTIPEPLARYRIHGGSITVNKYFRQVLESDYLHYRRDMKDKQQPYVSLTEYEQQRTKRSPLTRFNGYMHNMSRMNYRQAGMMVGEKRYQEAIGKLLLAGLYNPPYVVKRLWDQRFSPRAQRHLSQANQDQAERSDTDQDQGNRSTLSSG
jgi:glycosyltransferase involved in cell wall biosynthesis